MTERSGTCEVYMQAARAVAFIAFADPTSGKAIGNEYSLLDVSDRPVIVGHGSTAAESG